MSTGLTVVAGKNASKSRGGELASQRHRSLFPAPITSTILSLLQATVQLHRQLTPVVTAYSILGKHSIVHTGMPPKRRTTTPRGAGPQRQTSAQSTLSFHGKNNKSKVTKSQSPRTAKSTKKDPALLEELVDEDAQSIKAEADPDLSEPTTAEKAIQEQVQSTTLDLETVDDPLANSESKTEDVLGGRAQKSDVGATGGKAGSGWVGDEEAQARKVKDTEIKRYWRNKESERKAPRVHQEGLSVHEKILREWDMSGQYGVSNVELDVGEMLY